MHSLQALALIQEKRIASDGSLWLRSQRRPSSTDWPNSNGTPNVSQRAAPASLPRLIFKVATLLMTAPLTRRPKARRLFAAHLRRAVRAGAAAIAAALADNPRADERRGFRRD